MPPVPPDNRSPHGGNTPGDGKLSEADAQRSDSKHRDVEQQGRQGNLHQNTTHPGHQQDR